MSDRPFIIVPPGLREWFKREACGGDEDVIPLYDIREVDPTHPGLSDEDMALLRGDYDDELFEDDAPEAEDAPAEKAPKARMKLIPGGRDRGGPGAAPS